jgi:outer membrane protein assembly factor BamB
MVYVNDHNSKVRALRAADGTEIWNSPIGTEFDLAVGKNAVYISKQHGEVQALRIKDGTTIWHLTAERPNPLVIAAGNIVYIASNNLYAVSAADGKHLWSFPASVSSLTAAPGVIYVSAGVSLYALRT